MGSCSKMQAYLRPLGNLQWASISQKLICSFRKTYIVYMGDHPKGMDPASLPSLHMTMAQKVLGSKIIGAKYFNIEGANSKDDIISPRDAEGHGSHTASTIAGNLVKSASLLGFASGTARGG
ncbi:hypothetical protein JHK85_005531 [Glycine max]|nr:hypothetical protein JHK85_005531 [Glycine max]